MRKILNLFNSLCRGLWNVLRLVKLLRVLAILAAVTISASAQTNDPPVEPGPTYIGENYYEAFSVGFGLGLVFYGFGWKLRIVRQIGKSTPDF